MGIDWSDLRPPSRWYLVIEGLLPFVNPAGSPSAAGRRCAAAGLVQLAAWRGLVAEWSAPASCILFRRTRA
jgi:hypothetical protein